MIIKKIAFGNEVEAYIETRLQNKVNIIFSDDNHKGKTLVMQGLMYSMGYESIFPSTFEYKNYYFYSNVEINNSIFEFLRKKNSFIIKENGALHIFNSVSEYKYYFSKHIIQLPYIIKDKYKRIVDLSLFFEIFFIGQDERSPISLISKGQFNKIDFENMIYAYMNLGIDTEEENLTNIKEKIKSLKVEKKLLQKQLLLKNNNVNIAEQVFKSIDNEKFYGMKTKLVELNKNISNFKRKRTRENNRKVKLEVLLSELNSLNRKLEEGKVKCLDCGSERILYTNGDYNFDISNIYVRNEVINSIKENIEEKEELIFEYTENINNEQDLLTKQIDILPLDIRDILLYQEEILSERDIDSELFSKIQEIEYHTNLKEAVTTEENSSKEEKRQVLIKILEEMKSKYIAINPNGNLIFDSLFAKKDATFSGSESQEYYFSKLLALNNVLQHEFPLIVDSFRDGELSTEKEQKMLEYYKLTNKQVILTATLKAEEYSSKKYNADSQLNVLDYSSYPNSHILQKKYANDFIDILNMFAINIKDEE